MKKERLIVVTGSPQIHDESSTINIMWSLGICLLPAAGWGLYIFGLPAALVLFVSIGTALLSETLFSSYLHRFSLWDGSAFVTGLLVGMNMPPSVPLYVPAAASLFAIGVVKWTFGGLGRNWMNPALAGRVFVLFSWPAHMTRWTSPATLQGADRISAATPLGFLKTGMMGSSGMFRTPMEFLSQNGYPRSLIDGDITDWLNAGFLGSLGINLPQGYVDIFLGNIPGCIGEVSALLLLAGTVYLLARRIITWEIPLSYFGTFGVLVWALGGLRFGGAYFTGDVLFHLFTGGLMLGVFYMAGDMVTSPLTRRGMIIYGTGAGFLTFLIRFYGSFPEGVSLAIIFMNMFVPLINRATGPARFGVEKEKDR
jgi:electron transport complex protein RnfD